MKRKTRFFVMAAAIILSVACGYFVYARMNGKATRNADLSGETGTTGGRRVPVVLTPVSSREFERRLEVQGNMEAKNTAMVPARLSGTIESIFVDEGDWVIEGKTRLFQIDSLKLKKSVEVSRQALEVTRLALVEKKANLERVQADFEKAKIDNERFKALLEDRTVSADEFEQIESRYKQTRAMLKHARSLVALAAEQQRQAEAALEIAEKDLRDTLVYAPLSGRVSQRYLEPGEMGDMNIPVLRIEDPSIIEVSAFLPAQHYPLVRPGETEIFVRVYEIDLGEQTISYKSPTIDSKLRTFEVKCTIEHPPDGVVPGGMAEITVVLERRKGLGVPAVALQKRSGRTVVFVVDDHVARSIEVAPGLETDGWVELTGPSLKETTPVVTMGQFLLEEGTRVSIQEERS